MWMIDKMKRNRLLWKAREGEVWREEGTKIVKKKCLMKWKWKANDISWVNGLDINFIALQECEKGIDKRQAAQNENPKMRGENLRNSNIPNAIVRALFAFHQRTTDHRQHPTFQFDSDYYCGYIKNKFPFFSLSGMTFWWEISFFCACCMDMFCGEEYFKYQWTSAKISI